MRRLIIIALLISIFSKTRAQSSVSAVADPILDVIVKDESGNDRVLRSLLSNTQPTFLIIWEAQTCPPCAKTIKNISDSLAYKRMSASIVPICVLDSNHIIPKKDINPWDVQRTAYKDLKNRFNLKGNNYYDERNEISNKLNLEAYPVIYVLSGERTLMRHSTLSINQLFTELAKRKM